MSGLPTPPEGPPTREDAAATDAQFTVQLPPMGSPWTLPDGRVVRGPSDASPGQVAVTIGPWGWTRARWYYDTARAESLIADVRPQHAAPDPGTWWEGGHLDTGEQVASEASLPALLGTLWGNGPEDHTDQDLVAVAAAVEAAIRVHLLARYAA